MSGLSYLEKLLDGVEVEWIDLDDVFDIFAGGDVPKDSFSDVQTKDFNIPILSNGIGNNSLYGWTNKAKIDLPSLTISARGTIGWTSYRVLPFFPVIRLLVLTPKLTLKFQLNLKYSYYYMKTIEGDYRVPKTGIPQLTKPMLKGIRLPIPCPDNPEKSLAIQSEIVRILDTFTALTNELTNELKLRRQQYNYYREQLLSFKEGEVEWKRLGEIAEYSKTRISFEQLDETNYVGVDNLLQNCEGKTQSNYVPKSGNFTEFREKDILIGNIRPYLRKIWQADCAGGTNGDVLVIRCNNNSISVRYLYQVLADGNFFEYNMKYAKGAKMPRGNKEAILKYRIPIPPFNEQIRIITILDKFDTLTNSISEGLPLEIELRKKQYEYYRDLLYSFPKPVSADN
ncbi:restriction endonuclease subunit S [Salmonella enterica]|nr:restriction endonuclease subunit S [Salmonella enterica]EMD4778451.1 restriction endonuclease subunit S [Salmonella enterica]EMD4796763.1 restriction endonuclease subunit S [Salmonella enterica]EMD4837584.1 restriction endonuclease subunit S [Salmonella enterica]